MSSDRPARRKRKCWVLPCSCFCAGNEPDESRSPVSSNDGLRCPFADLSANVDIVRVTSSGDRRARTVAKDEGDAQSTKSSELDLWDKALTCLEESNEDRDIITIVQEFAKKSTKGVADLGSSPVKGLAKDIKESMEQKIKDQQVNREQHAWKITIGQHEYSVREFVDKTVTILNKFVAVGDVATSFDPVHAALPWAAVRFFLAVSGSGLYGVLYLSRCQVRLSRVELTH